MVPLCVVLLPAYGLSIGQLLEDVPAQWQWAVFGGLWCTDVPVVGVPILHVFDTQNQMREPAYQMAGQIGRSAPMNHLIAVLPLYSSRFVLWLPLALYILVTLSALCSRLGPLIRISL